MTEIKCVCVCARVCVCVCCVLRACDVYFLCLCMQRKKERGQRRKETEIYFCKRAYVARRLLYAEPGLPGNYLLGRERERERERQKEKDRVRTCTVARSKKSTASHSRSRARGTEDGREEREPVRIRRAFFHDTWYTRKRVGACIVAPGASAFRRSVGQSIGRFRR